MHGDLTIFWGEQPAPIKTKPCIYCKVEKSLDQFASLLTNHDKRDNRCKECCRKHSQYRAYLKKTVRPKPDACECCGKSALQETKNRKLLSLVLDHDHKTGKFRGWICHDCNSALGRAGDNLEGVMNLMKYLEKHEQPI